MNSALDFYYAELKARGFTVEPEKTAEMDDTTLLAREFYNQSIIDGVTLEPKERLKMAAELAQAWEKKVAEFATGFEATLDAKCKELGVSLDEGLKIAAPETEGSQPTPAPGLKQAPPTAKPFAAKAKSWMGRNPLASAGIAAGVGFLGSRLLSKD